MIWLDISKSPTDGQWRKYNDLTVTMEQLNDDKILTNSYVLFYQKYAPQDNYMQC